MLHIKMKKFILSMILSVFFTSSAWAGFIDFEDGVDHEVIASTIEGMEFTTTNGYDWVYGDWRTGEYNGPYPNGADRFSDQYYSDGNFFAWLGVDQGTGIITFVDAYATFFEINYSSQSELYLEAYDIGGNLLDSDSGSGNLDTGLMGLLHVDAPGLSYVMIHDTGNYWLVDNLYTDAIMQCRCDDHCQDGNFYTGEKYCNLLTERCEIGGSPCTEGETCDEDADSCVEIDNTDDDDDNAGDDDDKAGDDDTASSDESNDNDSGSCAG